MQVDSQAALTAKIESMRKAQRAFAAYTQEQVDEIFLQPPKQPIGSEFRWLKWRWRKLVWGLLRIKF